MFTQWGHTPIIDIYAWSKTGWIGGIDSSNLTAGDFSVHLSNRLSNLWDSRQWDLGTQCVGRSDSRPCCPAAAESRSTLSEVGDSPVWIRCEVKIKSQQIWRQESWQAPTTAGRGHKPMIEGKLDRKQCILNQREEEITKKLDILRWEWKGTQTLWMHGVRWKQW